MPHTLLLADDSLTIQRVIELTFADSGVSVVAVGDGDEAVRVLSNTPPDIVLADVDMPGPSGYDIAEHVRRTPSLAHIPVLLLTGAFEPVDEHRARDAGSNGVLTKPFDPAEVVRRVHELLAAPPSVVEAPPPPRPTLVVPAREPEPEFEPQPEAQMPPAAAPTADEPFLADDVRVSTTVDDYFEQLDQAFAARMAASAARPPVPVAEEPSAPGRPLLASAFSALLDAESSGADDVEVASRFVPPGGSAPLPVLSEDVIEQIARRVVERLSDRLVRETVAGVVSATAERLVTQEIERIKSNIK